MYAIRRTRTVAMPPPGIVPSPASAQPGQATLHYQDHHFDHPAVKLLPGEYYATARDLLLVTVLGSCVAACICDEQLRIGGMNHFMLPSTDAAVRAGDASRYGMFAMEMLINDLMKRGARRSALTAKLFGGGNVLASLASSDVGGMNVAFAERYLEREGIPVVAADTLGNCPRKVYYWPQRHHVMLRRLASAQADGVVGDEQRYLSRVNQPSPAPAAGAVELFD